MSCFFFFHAAASRQRDAAAFCSQLPLRFPERGRRRRRTRRILTVEERRRDLGRPLDIGAQGAGGGGGVLFFLHSDVVNKQTLSVQKSPNSYCDNVSTESCFGKIKLYFVFAVWLFSAGETLRPRRPPPGFSWFLSKQEAGKMKEGQAAVLLPSHTEAKCIFDVIWSVFTKRDSRQNFLCCFSHCGKSLKTTTCVT